MRQITATTFAVLLLLAGCGEEEKSATPATSKALGEDALLAVYDTMYECLRKQEGVVLTQFSDGRAVVSSSITGHDFDDAVAAPEATAKAVAAGAQFIGVRDDRREKGTAPDWDILIFPSEQAASDAAASLSGEAPATADGRFVTVPLGEPADDAAVAACRESAT